MPLSTIWRLIAHHQEPEAALSWIKQNRLIAIGWGFVGDIGVRKYMDASAIAKEIAASYALGQHPYRNSGAGGANLWSFYDEVQIDDFVIIVARGRELVVKVVGDYEFIDQDIPKLGNYYHQRKVELTSLNADQSWHSAGAKAAKGYNIRSTLVRLTKQVDIENL